MDDDHQHRGRRAPATPPAPSPAALEAVTTFAEAMTTLRAAYATVLDALHVLDTDDIAARLGYPSTHRLLHDHARLDRGEITVLRRHARLTHPSVQLSGHHTPPVLAATATASSDGAVGEGHVRVVAAVMTFLAALPHVDHETVEVTEARLAALARILTPAALADAAAEICAELDPDGAAPTDTGEPADELRMLRRRDGSLHGRFRFLDPVSAEVVHTALQALTPAPTADGDPTATDHPTGPADLDGPDDLGGRPLEQRRAQGLRDLCATTLTRGFDADPDNRDVESEPDSAATASTGTVNTDPDAGPVGHMEFYAPDGHCEVDDLCGQRPGTQATAPVDEPVDIPARPAVGLFAELAATLADPDALDSVLEQTISALLDQHPPRPTTNPASADTAKKGLTRPPGDGVEGGERVHLAVTIDYDTLTAPLATTRRGGAAGQPRLPGLGYLGSGAKIGPETARRLACDADLIPTILGSRSEPLDIGRKTRVVPLPIRRAVVVRDRHCAFPGCRRRPQSCQVHHVQHWIFGGDTKIDNLVLVCSFHHMLLHHSDWTVTIIGGLPWFTPPSWLDRERQPRNNRPWRTDPTPTCPA